MAEVAAAEVPARAQWLPKRGGSRSSSVLPRSPCWGHPLPWVGGLRGEAFCWALPPLWRGRQPRTPGHTWADGSLPPPGPSPAGLLRLGGLRTPTPSVPSCPAGPPEPLPAAPRRGVGAGEPGLESQLCICDAGPPHLDPREVRGLRGASGGRWGGAWRRPPGKPLPGEAGRRDPEVRRTVPQRSAWAQSEARTGPKATHGVAGRHEQPVARPSTRFVPSGLLGPFLSAGFSS